MKKVKALEIKQFRGIKNLSIPKFGDINMFVGDNNVGKTTILEAIDCFKNPLNIDAIARVARNRVVQSPGSSSLFEAFMMLFPVNTEDQKNIELSIDLENLRHKLHITGKRTQLWVETGIVTRNKIDPPPVAGEVDAFEGRLTFDGSTTDILLQDIGLMTLSETTALLPVSFVGAMSHHREIMFTPKTMEHKDDILEVLKLFDGQIIDFNLVQKENGYTRSYIVIRHTELGTVPLYIFGDGLKRVLTLASYLVTAQNGVLLIDEIDTSIHFSVLTSVFEWLVEACRKFNVQVFATTHSLEALKVLSSVANMDDASDLATYKIERYEDAFWAKRFGEEQLEYVVNEAGQEIR